MNVDVTRLDVRYEEHHQRTGRIDREGWKLQSPAPIGRTLRVRIAEALLARADLTGKAISVSGTAQSQLTDQGLNLADQSR